MLQIQSNYSLLRQRLQDEDCQKINSKIQWIAMKVQHNKLNHLNCKRFTRKSQQIAKSTSRPRNRTQTAKVFNFCSKRALGDSNSRSSDLSRNRRVTPKDRFEQQ
ncbi:hypothetical protein HUJ04_012484, partial [Dendroctonus ponderosae]